MGFIGLKRRISNLVVYHGALDAATPFLSWISRFLGRIHPFSPITASLARRNSFVSQAFPVVEK